MYVPRRISTNTEAFTKQSVCQVPGPAVWAKDPQSSRQHSCSHIAHGVEMGYGEGQVNFKCCNNPQIFVTDDIQDENQKNLGSLEDSKLPS